jgi:hypothetical protein
MEPFRMITAWNLSEEFPWFTTPNASRKLFRKKSRPLIKIVAADEAVVQQRLHLRQVFRAILKIGSGGCLHEGRCSKETKRDLGRKLFDEMPMTEVLRDPILRPKNALSPRC